MANIEKRSNNTYKITVCTGYDTKGKKLRKSKTVKISEKLTEKQLEKELNRQAVLFEQEVQSGSYLDGEKITFAQFTQKWLDEYAEKNLAPGTLNPYKMKLQKRILPALGHIKLSKLQPHHLMEFYNNLNEDNVRLDGRCTPTERLKKHLAPLGISDIEKATGITFKTCQRLKSGKDTTHAIAQKLCTAYDLDIEKMFALKSGKKLAAVTVRNHHCVICSILSTAVRWNIIIHNPAMRVDLKKAPKSKAGYYDNEKITLMLDALENEPLRYKAMVYLAVDTGMRKGELTGLTWDDVDFEKSEVNINKQRHYVNGYGIIETSPKTENGTRVVTISKTAAAILKEYKKQQNKDRLRLGTA
jgi:site-specific recombinase XerD